MTCMKMKTTIIEHEHDAIWSNQQFVIRAAAMFYRITRQMRWFQRTVLSWWVSSRLFSTETETIACLPPFRPRLSPASFVSPNNEYDTTWLLDEMCVPDGCCGERNAARSASTRMELKRVSCACFGGRSFAMSLLASLIRMNNRTNVNVARSWILDFSSKMFVKLP